MPDRPAGRDHLGRRDDALRVDAEMPVEVLDVPVWPKCSTPSERVRWPVTEPSQASVAGWPSITVTSPQWGGSVAEQPLDMAARMDEAALARPLRRRPAGVEPVGGGDGEQADVAPVLGHEADRLDRLRRDRARIGDDHLGVRAGLAQPVGAVDDVRGKRPASSSRCGCSRVRVERRR